MVNLLLLIRVLIISSRSMKREHKGQEEPSLNTELSGLLV